MNSMRYHVYGEVSKSHLLHNDPQFCQFSAHFSSCPSVGIGWCLNERKTWTDHVYEKKNFADNVLLSKMVNFVLILRYRITAISTTSWRISPVKLSERRWKPRSLRVTPTKSLMKPKITSCKFVAQSQFRSWKILLSLHHMLHVLGFSFVADFWWQSYNFFLCKI